jgi:myosin heavy subunit
VEELERILKENKCSMEALRVEISTVTTCKDALQNQLDEHKQRIAASANDPNYPKYSENEYSEYGRQQIAFGKSQQAMEEEATRSSSAGVSEEEMSALLAKHQEELKAAEEKHTSELKTLLLQTKQAEQLLEEEKRAKEEGADLALQGLNMIQTECDQKIQAMESEVKQCNEKMEMMTNKHTTYVTLVSKGNATIKEKEQEILALKAQKDSFSRKEEQYHEKEQFILAEIKASKIEIEKFEAVTKKTSEINIALETELKTTKKHLKLAKQKTEGMEAYVKEQVAAGQEAVDAKTKEIRDMKTKFKKTKDSRLTVIAKMKALETELEEKKEFFKKSNMKNATELTRMKGHVDRLEERHRELSHKQANESKQVLSLTSENADMEMKLSELEEEKKFLMSTLETVMAELEASRRMMPQEADSVLVEDVVETY